MTSARSLALPLALMLAQAGCGKSEEASAEKKKEAPVEKEAEQPEQRTAGEEAPEKAEASRPEAPEKEAAPEQETEPAKAVAEAEEEALPPQTPEEVEAQCKSLLSAAWTAIQPAMAKLQIPEPASHEEDYKTGYSAKKFMEACQKVDRAGRECMVESEKPLSAPGLCDIDRKRAGGKQLKFPQVPGTSPLFESEELPADNASAMLAKLPGSWTADSGFGSSTWTITDDGKVVVERKDAKGEDKKKSKLDEFTLSFEEVNHARRQYPGSNAQTITFFMPTDEAFYSSGNLQHGAFDMKDGKNFVAREASNWFFMTDGKCEVVTYYGQIVPATCEQVERDGKTMLEVSYQIPGKAWRGKPQPDKATYVIVANHLLPRSFAERMRFEKQ